MVLYRGRLGHFIWTLDAYDGVYKTSADAIICNSEGDKRISHSVSDFNRCFLVSEFAGGRDFNAKYNLDMDIMIMIYNGKK